MSGLGFVSRCPILHSSLRELSSASPLHWFPGIVNLDRLICISVAKTHHLSPALLSDVVIEGVNQQKISYLWHAPKPSPNSRCHCTTTWKQPCQSWQQTVPQTDHSSHAPDMKTAVQLQQAFWRPCTLLPRQSNSQRCQHQQANQYGLIARQQVLTTPATPPVSTPHLTTSYRHPFEARVPRQSCSDSVPVGNSWSGAISSSFLAASSHRRINQLNNSSNITRAFSTTTVTSTASTQPTMGLKELQDAKAKFEPPSDLGTKVPPTDVRRFMLGCMTAAGVEEDKAGQLADVLVAADLRGHFSHGLNRLEMYVNDCREKICNGNASPSIEKQSVSTALVNGNNGLGPVVGNFCIELAISKAKETGIGWVCARGSNHYGIAGWYAMKASDQGLLGMSFTNTSPLVAPTRAKGPALGTNPLSLAAPAKKDDPFVLDMATCTVALGKIEVCRRKGDSIPEGWALDSEGKITTDPAAAMSGALMPLGGIESNSGYKGYGLAMLVEVFCGLLSGGQYGPNVRRWMDTTREADLGQCFVAIDPSFFAPGFPDRMADLMDHVRNMPPADPAAPVLAAGDPERAHIVKVEKEGGLTYHLNQITDSWKLANVLKVAPMAGV